MADTKPVSKYQKGLAPYIRGKNKNLSKNGPSSWRAISSNQARRIKIDPKVLMALAQRESNFRAKGTATNMVIKA